MIQILELWIDKLRDPFFELILFLVANYEGTRTFAKTPVNNQLAFTSAFIECES